MVVVFGVPNPVAVVPKGLKGVVAVVDAVGKVEVAPKVFMVPVRSPPPNGDVAVTVEPNILAAGFADPKVPVVEAAPKGVAVGC